MNNTIHSKFVTRTRNIVIDQLNENYDVGNVVIYNTEVLKANLCNYNDAYILVKDDITVTAAPETQVSYKNCAQFTNCITKIDGATIDDAEDSDLSYANVQPNRIQFYSLEYINYSKTTKSLWFYSKDEASNVNFDITNNNNNFKSFKYKPKLLVNTEVDGANDILKNTTIAVPLK